MRSSRHERETLAEFSARYAFAPSTLIEDIERRVIGQVWGANGFTTVAQADLLADHLDLAPGKRLLDVGTGRGWPGLYLAKRTGCEVALTDLPVEGLRFARRRAQEERLISVGAAVASARYLPFKPGSFDAIVHTDVLC